MKTTKPDDVLVLPFGFDLPANSKFKFDGVYHGFTFQLVETAESKYLKCQHCAFGSRQGGVCCSLIRCNPGERKDKANVIVVVKP